MTDFEKLFVNNPLHSRRTASQAARRLRGIPHRARQSYLDVGCGNGAGAIAIASAFGLEVTGLDVDPAQIRAARRAARGHRGVRFLVGDATGLPFPDGAFDIVATAMTTHHIPDWEGALIEMVRVLAPGGYLLYLDFALPRPLARLVPDGARRLARVPTRDALDRFADAHGLRSIRRTVRGLRYEAAWERTAANLSSERSGSQRGSAPR